MLTDLFKKAAIMVNQSYSLLVGAGAGMGKDSGLPDFRGKQGFWNNYPPYRNKFSFQQCANPQFLLNFPHLFWGFYGSRLTMYRNAKPHNGFHILKDISKNKESHFVITSNVDGHFSRFFDKVYEVHGSIHHLQCDKCKTITQNNFQPEIEYQKMQCKNLPKCNNCKQILRPNILMFNDYDWNDEHSSQQQKKYQQYLQSNLNKNVIIMEFGCGTAIPTIRNKLEQYFYRNKNSKMIRVNPDNDYSNKWLPADRYTYLKCGSLQALEGIRKQLMIMQ